MSTETLHEEFVRLGESAVEELFVRQGKDDLKRVYAVRWLGQSAIQRHAVGAARQRAEETRAIQARRAKRIAYEAIMVASVVAGIAVVLLRTAVFH